MAMNISGWFHKHLGPQNDFSRQDGGLLDEAARGPGRRAVVGAGLGAAVGTAAGFAYGLHNQAEDRVSIETRTHSVDRPVLVGADYDPAHYRSQPNANGKGTHLVRVDDDWDPIVQTRATGQTYTRKEFEHTRALGPVGGALIGLGVGTAVGALGGALVGMLSRDNDYLTLKDTGRGNKTPLIGAAAGVLAGAMAGGYAGALAQDRAEVLTQTIQEPVFTRQTIGFIPHDADYRQIPRDLFAPGHKLYYDRLDSSYGSVPFQGKEAVVRSVPTGEFSSRTISESSYRLTPLTGALLGAGIGGLAGLAGGVAVGVLQKTLEA